MMGYVENMLACCQLEMNIRATRRSESLSAWSVQLFIGNDSENTETGDEIKLLYC